MNLFLVILCSILLHRIINIVTSFECCQSHFCARDCVDLLQLGFSKSGVYQVHPGGVNYGYDVYCDMETDGGGWLVFQRRFNGSYNFNLGWNRYQLGFGDVNGEHWLGNQNLHIITSQGQYELRLELEDWEGGNKSVNYKIFRVADSLQNYTLIVGGFTGQSGGSSLHPHHGRPFLTKIDYETPLNNCGNQHQGGWWYLEPNFCLRTNLNGVYFQNSTTIGDRMGIVWEKWRGLNYSLKRTEMKIRRL